MQRSCFHRCKICRTIWWLQLALGVLVVIISFSSFLRFYSAGFFLSDGEICRHFYEGRKMSSTELSFNPQDIHIKIQALQNKLETIVKEMEKNAESKDPNALKSAYTKHGQLLVDDVMRPLDSIKLSLQLKWPPMAANSSVKAEHSAPDMDSLLDFFNIEEFRTYVTGKENRLGNFNRLRAAGTYTTIGHACALMKKELEEYMKYDIGGYCKDDWNLAQKLMVQGCDPLPRRRCLARAPRLFRKPLPINQSLWKIPDDRNVRWNNYQCKNFACLASNKSNKGFLKCSECFDLAQHEVPRWVLNTSSNADFLIAEVLSIKPGEIRIGLDFSVGIGSFAARMRERDVTIVSATLNPGAPFNEMIALRGLVPLYITINQRLPFFDNTLDLIHAGEFLDGLIDMQLLDFVIFDWDRVLRPGGFFWIDKFFCTKKDLDEYLYMFLQLRYKKHRWVVTPKNREEVYFSALLEKPPRSF